MPVQIPSLQRIAPQAPGAPDVSQGRAPNLVAGQEKIDKSILGAVNQFIKKSEEDTYDLVGDDMINKFRSEDTAIVEGDAKNNTPGLRHLKGNPTPTWSKHRENSNERFNAMLDSYSGSGKQKLRFMQKAAAMRNDIERRNMVYYGTQRERWDHDITNSDRANIRAVTVRTTGEIEPGKPETLENFSANIQRLDRATIDQSLRLKQATPGTGEAGEVSYVEDGQIKTVKMDDTSKRTLNKEASTAVLDSVRVLTSSLRVEEAKMVVDKHGDRLDPVDTAKVNKMLKSSDVKSQATIFVGENSNLTEREFTARLNKAAKNNPELKVEATKMRNSFTSAKINAAKREDDQSVSKAYEHIDKKMNSSKPYDSIYQMHNDPLLADTFSRNLTPTQRKLLDNRVTGGSDSPTPAADFNRFWDMYSQRRLQKMPMETFQKLIVNFNKPDRSKAISAWKKENGTLTVAGERSNEHQAVVKMKDLLKADGLYKTLSSSGKTTRETEERLNILNRITTELINGGSLPPRTADLNRVLAAKYKSAMDAYNKNKDYNSAFSKMGRGQAPWAPNKPLDIFDTPAETKSQTPVRDVKKKETMSDKQLFKSWSKAYRAGLMKKFRDANPGKRAKMEDLVKLHKESK